MTGAPVRATLARLAAAGARLRERSVAERLADLARVLEAWRDPGSATRRRLLDEHPAASGLSRETVAAGLDLALADWDGAALARWVEEELGSRAALAQVRLPGVTAVIHGGVIPMPTLVDVVAPLLLGSPVLSKPAARDPVTPRVLKESLEREAPALAGALALAEVHRDDPASLDTLLSAERVVVTGSDEAVRAIRQRLPPGTRLVAHGHKLSLALLGDAPGTDPAGAAARLAVDVALWDQLGCLSPLACFVIGDRTRADAFAAALADALAERERAWPRGELDPASAARLAAERADAELRAAAGLGVRLRASPGTAWTVITEPDARPRPAVLHRFVRVQPAADLAGLARALAPLAPHVTGLALAGLDPEDPALRALARTLGVSRVAPFGRLQAPPLDWARDGVPALASLLGGRSA